MTKAEQENIVMVTMADGTKVAIDQLKVGDAVKGSTGINHVVEVQKTVLENASMYGSLFEGQAVMTDKGWAAFDPQAFLVHEPETYNLIVEEQGTEVAQIQKGYKLITETGSIDATSLFENQVQKTVTLVEISLDGDHTYYLDGILVHNKGGKKKPKPPAPLPVITSGRISGPPTVYEIGSTRIVSQPPEYSIPQLQNRYYSPPGVPIYPPVTPRPPILRPAPTPSFDANAVANRAEDIRDGVCSDIIENSDSTRTFFQITGNGAAVRYPFPDRGEPIDIVVTNITTGASISASDYIVVSRIDSFAYINFDAAPTSGHVIQIAYTIGSAPTTSGVSTTDWRSWNSQITNLESELRTLRANVVESPNGVQYRCGVGTFKPQTWSISDLTLIDDALNAVGDFRRSIGRPGSIININEIGRTCDYLNKQIARITSELSMNVGFVPVLPVPKPLPAPIISGLPYFPGPVPCVRPPVINIHVDYRVKCRVFDNDIKWKYYRRGRGGWWYYLPPNQPPRFTKRWERKFDKDTNRYYYEPKD